MDESILSGPQKEADFENQIQIDKSTLIGGSWYDILVVILEPSNLMVLEPKLCADFIQLLFQVFFTFRLLMLGLSAYERHDQTTLQDSKKMANS